MVLERRATDGSWAVRWFDDLTVRGASKAYAGNEKDESLVEIAALGSEDDAIASRSITVSCLGNYEKRVTTLGRGTSRASSTPIGFGIDVRFGCSRLV